MLCKKWTVLKKRNVHVSVSSHWHDRRINADMLQCVIFGTPRAAGIARRTDCRNCWKLGIVGGRKWVWSRRKFEELCWTWTLGWERKGERGIYLKLLFFNTLFLYLGLSLLFAVCRANLKHVLTSVSLFTWCKILWLILGLCLCPFYVSSWSSFPQEEGHRPGRLPSKPRGSEVSNPSQVYLESHIANFPIWQRRLRSQTLSKSRGKPSTVAS